MAIAIKSIPVLTGEAAERFVLEAEDDAAFVSASCKEKVHGRYKSLILLQKLHITKGCKHGIKAACSPSH